MDITSVFLAACSAQFEVKLHCAHPPSPGQNGQALRLLPAGRTGLRGQESCSAAGLLGDSRQLPTEPSGKDGGVAWKLGRLELDTL